MSDVATLRRQLKIKTGAVKRLWKEHQSYKKEEESLKCKQEQLLAAGAEEWDIKNARKMQEESQKMITDTLTRLDNMAEELREVVIAASAEAALADDEELRNAKETLKEVGK